MDDAAGAGDWRAQPGRQVLYFSWSISGIGQIWKVDGPKQFPRQVTRRGGQHHPRRDRRRPQAPIWSSSEIARARRTQVSTFCAAGHAGGPLEGHPARPRRADALRGRVERRPLRVLHVERSQAGRLRRLPMQDLAKKEREVVFDELRRGARSVGLAADADVGGRAVARLQSLRDPQRPPPASAGDRFGDGRVLRVGSDEAHADSAPRAGGARRVRRALRRSRGRARRTHQQARRVPPPLRLEGWQAHAARRRDRVFDVDEASRSTASERASSARSTRESFTRPRALDRAKTLQPLARPSALPAFADADPRVLRRDDTRRAVHDGRGEDDGRHPLRGLVLDWSTRKLEAMALAEHAGDRQHEVRPGRARVVPGSGRHADPGPRAAAGPRPVRSPGAVPGRRELSRRPRVAGAARLQRRRADVRGRGLRLRRTERPGQRRVRQDMASRQTTGPSASGSSPTSRTPPGGRARTSRRPASSRASASSAAATAATPCSWE